MLNLRNKQRGFTIVELLIVIVVIGILAAITIVAYNGVQERARAVAIADGFKKIDKAFQLFAIEEGRSTWWLDSELTGSGNPHIGSVISNTNLKNYLQSEPSVSGMNSSYWIYDNDGETRNLSVCEASATGVNIAFENTNATQALAVDKIIDDGNLNCGHLRSISSTEIQYNLSGAQGVN